MLIKRCMDKYSNIRTYPDIGELAFGKTGRLIVSVSMYTELYLVSIGFLILEGDNLSNLFPIGEVQIAGLAIGGKQFFVILVSLIILPTVWLDNLSLLSYVSASGVFASAFIILSISWTATFDEVGFHQKGTSVNWNGIPTAVSLYAFCYCAHPVFPTLYNSMTNKHQFSNVLLLCFLLTTVGYASMAIIGYLMFGADVESQITLNLPLNKVSSKLAIYITLVNPISKYALMATPITNALKDLLPSTYKNRVTNILVSTVMVIGTTIVALVVPFYGYLMSLVGAFLSVTASILLPCFCYLKISGSYRRFELNQGLATLAFFGVGVNLVLFLTRVMGQDNAEAANNVSKWTGTVYLFSLLGAFLSDSYWGRYMTCAIFQVIFVIGLVSLSLSSHISLLKPSGCGDKELQCGSHSSSQTALFYLSIYLVALGNGGYQPNIATFGSDQFDEGDPKERLSKVAFFSYFYLALNLGSLFSNTILDYFEDKGQWTLGFWASAGSAAIALILFLCGTRRYRYFKPVGNPLPRVGQVFVAAGKKWKVKVLSEENLYEDEESSPSGRRKMLHTEGFRFLDKAAFITSKDLEQLEENKRNPWCLSTVTQVEEVKCILRLLPIWLCTIMYSVVFAQMASLFVVQGDAMATGISSFKIPPASMSSFDILGVAFFIFIYRHALDPFVAKVMKSKLTELQRMGIGLVLAIMAMVSAGLVEKFRLKYAIKDCNQCDGSSSLSIFWQVPQYVLTGASEVFMYVPQLEFFNAQTPDGLKSFGSALCMTSISLGNYVSSLLVAIVMKISTKGDIPGWIPGNLNLGHLDRFYFLLAALTTADLVVYVALAKWYKSIQFEENAEEDIKKENHEVMV
ncbi:hypothetical protein JHK82_051642 [Glycine max]|nr:hypothetical protein JHK85_052344 [Glycine max]KAG5092864.1 hypothetical protein JHK82_051642 [Glycine max]KHN13615.1 Nitrate transporter 1.5 [Glycine soja]